MNCAEYAVILADLVEKTLCPGDRAAAEAHTHECESCRKLLDIVEGRAEILPEESGSDLARAIIRRTSGAACPAVESRLCDFVDGNLDQTSSRLLALHLDYCRGCRKVADELAVMKEVLPGMADLDPGPGFTRMVVRATSARQPVRASLRTRLLLWWNRAVQRPRFSFEAAYLGTLVLVFAFANPIHPLGNNALERLGSTRVIPAARSAVARIMPSHRIRALNVVLELDEVVAQKEKAALESLDSLLARAGQMSATSINWQVRRISSWWRWAVDASSRLGSRISPRFSRAGK